MPKRKRSVEDEMFHLMRKVKKLKRKFRRTKYSDSDSDSREEDSPTRDCATRMRSEIHQPESPCPPLDPDIWLSDSPAHVADNDCQITEQIINDACQDIQASVPTNDSDKTASVLAPEKPSLEEPQELDTDTLEILGDDPLSQIKYNKDIRPELASRLQHLAQEGLSKEIKKTLKAKYPLPANCLYIGAPKINPELKAALADIAIKRDKAIEAKQMQMTSAVSCLGEIITSHLNSKNRDNELLQKLMDVTRLLCDIQHNDSATRKHFVLSSLKKDMKDHLTSTKIDSFLFGENLAETIKSARAVNKSGVELKADDKTQPKKSSTSFPKNRRAPGQARRHPGPSTKSRGPAAPRAPAPPPPAYGSYRTAWPAPPPPPPPPPPPAPPATRRRY